MHLSLTLSHPISQPPHKTQGGRGGVGEGKHTTDTNNMQSVLDRNDLDELMAMVRPLAAAMQFASAPPCNSFCAALLLHVRCTRVRTTTPHANKTQPQRKQNPQADLADRDFTAERYQPVVLSMGGAPDAPPAPVGAAERAAAEERFGEALQVPRRPPWDAGTTPDMLDAQERQAFLDWRRRLARLEEEEGLVLTPFERNLEVWRQLWRVLERSDVVVQVVDARDPLTYWSDSLARYAADIHETKASLVLLNKADLLPAAVRAAWADYFDARGRRYVFWSAAAAADAQARARHEASALGLPAPAPMAEQRMAAASAGDGSDSGARHAAAGGGGSGSGSGGDERIRILGVEELLELLEAAARDAVDAAEADDPRR